MMALVPKPQPPDSAPRQLPTDAVLVLAARSGQEWAREALFRRYARLTLALAYRILPYDADIDDLVQDSFLYAFERLDGLSNPQAFQA